MFQVLFLFIYLFFSVQGNVIVDRISSSSFYFEENQNCNYVGFSIKNANSFNLEDSWIEFSTTSNVLVPTPKESKFYRIGRLEVNSTAFAYFYLQCKHKSSGEEYTINIYHTNPVFNQLISSKTFVTQCEVVERYAKHFGNP